MEAVWTDSEFKQSRWNMGKESVTSNTSLPKLNLFDEPEQIDNSAKEYLKKIKGSRADEELLIKDISEEQWDEIKLSKYPKVLLGFILGASEEDIMNNFGLIVWIILEASVDSCLPS